MTIEQEVDSSVILTADELEDYGDRCYKSGLYFGAYVPRNTFWRGVIAGALAAWAVVMVVWALH